jgi:hypothetical protein
LPLCLPSLHDLLVKYSGSLWRTGVRIAPASSNSRTWLRRVKISSVL